MYQVFGLSLVATLAILSGHVAAYTCEDFGDQGQYKSFQVGCNKYLGFDGKRSTTPLTNSTAPGYSDCADRCSGDVRCGGYEYNHDNKNCLLWPTWNLRYASNAQYDSGRKIAKYAVTVPEPNRHCDAAMEGSGYRGFEVKCGNEMFNFERLLTQGITVESFSHCANKCLGHPMCDSFMVQGKTWCYLGKTKDPEPQSGSASSVGYDSGFLATKVVTAIDPPATETGCTCCVTEYV